MTRRFKDEKRRSLYMALLAWNPEDHARSRSPNDAWFYGRENPAKPCPPIYKTGVRYAAWAAGVDGVQSS